MLSTTSGTSAGHSGPSASPATRLALDASTEHSCSHKSPGHPLILTDHRPISDGPSPFPSVPTRQTRSGLPGAWGQGSVPRCSQSVICGSQNRPSVLPEAGWQHHGMVSPRSSERCGPDSASL